ncbi:AsmA family protein [Dyella lutea]|uniref:AsmA family protein n=1 Tax=Dyella lutea TaxID=2950441 RepID=A0ABT1F8U7_9GAMM|nr:AsmA family protein [Dyella lutea]MCP1373793.1 AsmA family protein [Dyella lutea]
MTRRRRIVAWIVAALVALTGLLVLVVALFDWNRLKPFIDDKVSQAIGRPFAIHGDLTVNWRRPQDQPGWRSWLPWPEFTARDITIANPGWTKQPHFAHLDALRFRLSPLALLAHRIDVPSLQLVQPGVELERDGQGRNNWTFTLPHGDRAPRWSLQLGNVGFDRGRVTLDDATHKTDLTVQIEPLQKAMPYDQVVAQSEQAAQTQARDVAGASAAKAVAGDAATDKTPGKDGHGTKGDDVGKADGAARDTRYQFRWTAEGHYQGAPAKGSGRIGAVLALQRKDRPFPVQAQLQVGDTHIGLAGTLTDPLHLGALDLHLWFAGTSMARLYPLLGVTLPDTHPYATRGDLSARLGDHGSRFDYRHFHGRVGDSDLSGNLRFVTGDPRPKLSGDLHSQELEFGDLAPLIGADSNAEKRQRGDGTAQPADKALPVEPFRTDRWRAMDADVTFAAAHVSHMKALPIDSLATHLVMDGGRLTLDPLAFGLAGGKVHGQLTLDGGQSPMRGHAELDARHIRLKALFPEFDAMRTSLGEINGRTDLDAAGNSVAALLGSANGEVKLLMNDGAISRNLLEAAGLNVGNIILGKLFGDRTVQIDCAATDLSAHHGLFRTRLFVFDTKDAEIDVDGTVDMASEKLDLDVRPQTKGLRILSLRSPLYVRGTLKHPDVGVQAGPLALRAGGAVALGAVAAPAAALLALISPDHDQPPNTCQRVLQQLRGTGDLRVGEPKRRSSK